MDPRTAEWSEEDYSVLEARTRALRAPPPSRRSSTFLEAIYVTAGGARFALPVRSVFATSSSAKVAALPGSPRDLAGIVEWHGLVIPAFHFHELFGIEGSSSGRLVIVGDEEPELALCVEDFQEFTTLDLARIRSTPESLSASTRKMALGLDEWGALIVDDRALLSSEKLIVDIHPSFETELEK